MRRIPAILLTVLVLVAMASCGSSADAGAVDGSDQVAAANAIPVENAFFYTHVDGHRTETEKLAFVLFEYEQLKTVKYQIAYIACTCRSPDVNYYSVAYVELSKEDGSVTHISFEQDSEGHYVAGLYGDSDESWDGTPVRELFDGFIEERIMGATPEDIAAYVPMHGNVDGYTGATVTPNNAVAMLKGLLGYHTEHYL